MHVRNEEILAAVERLDAIPQRIELVGRERAVDRPPGNRSLGAGLLDDIAVSWRTTGPVAGFHDERASGGQFTFTALDGFFDQLSGADVDVYGVSGLRHEFPVGPGPIPPCFVAHRVVDYTEKKCARL